MALPAWVAADLVPGLDVPGEHRSIVNAHFAVAPPPGSSQIVAARSSRGTSRSRSAPLTVTEKRSG
jgi:hypothetical protein